MGDSAQVIIVAREFSGVSLPEWGKATPFFQVNALTSENLACLIT